MNKWAERAAVHFSRKPQVPTPKTPKSPLMGVMGAGVTSLCVDRGDLMGVLGVPTVDIFKTEDAMRLVAAAMLACDHFKDSQAAREAMRDEVLATPAEHWPDLIKHFHETYPPVLAGR
ncbi:hypothetical protein [Rhodoferax sp. GW822-FHT02A01]|uniref:hypothetical protein n=1 Tax=Rhodoferax sp. GW822-FHT02A01 TaxID=3141537 RepID=UPI00315D882A